MAALSLSSKKDSEGRPKCASYGPLWKRERGKRPSRALLTFFFCVAGVEREGAKLLELHSSNLAIVLWANYLTLLREDCIMQKMMKQSQEKIKVIQKCTELRKFLCTWFGEVCSCCCLSPLPQLACIILATTYKGIFSALYRQPTRTFEILPRVDCATLCAASCSLAFPHVS